MAAYYTRAKARSEVEPEDSTCSPTGILDAIVVVVTEAESLGSKSSGSTSPRALALV